jgi:hypothetical protein
MTNEQEALKHLHSHARALANATYQLVLLMNAKRGPPEHKVIKIENIIESIHDTAHAWYRAMEKANEGGSSMPPQTKSGGGRGAGQGAPAGR